MNHRVRFKLGTKIKLLFGLLFFASVWAFFEYRDVNFQTPQVEYRSYFEAEVINRHMPESSKVVSKIKNDSRFPNTSKYPYEVRVKTAEQEFIIGSFKQSFIGDIVCIGVLVDSNSRKIVNYVKVDFENCR